MKLTKEQKKEIKNQIKKEKAPKVLNFEKEITLKKNENLTIGQIQEKVEISKKLNKNFIKDENLRFNFRLAEMKKEKLIEIKNELNQKFNISLTDKIISTLSAHTKDEKQLVKLAEQLINILIIDDMKISNINKIKKISSYEVWKNAHKLWKEHKNSIPKNEKKMNFKDFVLQNKHLTLKEAKEQFSTYEKAFKSKEISFEDFEEKAFKEAYVEIFQEFTNEPESLFNIFHKLVFPAKGVTNNKEYRKCFEKMNVQSFSILKAFSKINN